MKVVVFLTLLCCACLAQFYVGDNEADLFDEAINSFGEDEETLAASVTVDTSYIIFASNRCLLDKKRGEFSVFIHTCGSKQLLLIDSKYQQSYRCNEPISNVACLYTPSLDMVRLVSSAAQVAVKDSKVYAAKLCRIEKNKCVSTPSRNNECLRGATLSNGFCRKAAFEKNCTVGVKVSPSFCALDRTCPAGFVYNKRADICENSNAQDHGSCPNGWNFSKNNYGCQKHAQVSCLENETPDNESGTCTYSAYGCSIDSSFNPSSKQCETTCDATVTVGQESACGKLVANMQSVPLASMDY